ncbi:cobalt ECF transporter T component CbiQ [Pilimelia columellifera]|uniref:Cobalt ECF transporter T component CbiQ n=1 Tax=Pilimelia columellifera subsp. columellifera TaxID=706583 RepID=A0ABN3NIU6_9ACTN
MGAGHGLYRDQSSPAHRLAPEVKIAATVAFTLAVVATPREELWAFAVYAGLVAVAAVAARTPPGWLASRALIELPFVLFAFALPFLATGPTVEWGPLSLSVEGLYGAWNILAKGTLGVLASLLLAATTPAEQLLVGLDRLRCPSALTQIATFMIRYLQVLVDEARRMRVARISRGDDPRFLWQLRGFAAGIGGLFLRAYERGERVYLAMVSRGYSGRLPDLGTGGPAATTAQWLRVAPLPALAAVTAVTAAIG